MKREAEEDWVKELLAMSVAPESGRNRIMIYGPKADGTYELEFQPLTARRWQLAYRQVRPECLSISRRALPDVP